MLRLWYLAAVVAAMRPDVPHGPGLPAWLVDLLPPAGLGCTADLTGPPVAALAMTSKGLGRRHQQARELGCGEMVGIDRVNEAVVELLAAGALPRAATLQVRVAPDDRHGIALVAGVLRSMRGHGLQLACVEAVLAAEGEHVGITVAGGVVSKPRAPTAGDVVLALLGNGPVDGDGDWMLARMKQLELCFGDGLPSGDTLGPALLAPRASHDGVLNAPLRQGWPAQLIAVGEPGLRSSIDRALPRGLGVALDLSTLAPPAPFPTLLRGSHATEQADCCSLGCSMVAIVAASEVSRWVQWFAAWNEPLAIIGKVVESQVRA